MDFAIVKTHEQIIAVTRDPKNLIRRVVPIQDNASGEVMHVIYFDNAEDVTQDELGLLGANHFTATVVSQDERFQALKSNEQREAFLLTQLGINSEQARKIITLAKMIDSGTLPKKTTVAL